MLNSLGVERKPKGKQISMNIKLSHFVCRRWRSAICTGKRRKAFFMSIFAIKVPVIIQSTLFRACGDHIKTQFRACRAHYNSTLVETIQSTLFRTCRAHYNSMLVETIQSTLFRARGDHIKHTIPRACGAHYKFHTRGDNTKHTILHLRRPHKAYNSALAESTLRYI